ncbi:MAG: LegC family aminotransferase [Coriobacteriia bacterium]
MSDAPFLPLSEPVLGGNEWRYVKECLDTGWVSTAGRFVTAFEDSMCDRTGAPNAVACQSGSAALHVALLSLGVGPGDEVIVPTITFIASVNAVAYTGASPVFMDCDGFMDIDPAKVAGFLESECERTDRGVVDRATGCVVKAIMPVHVFGNPCDMVSLLEIADVWGLPVVEDAAESIGSTWTAGPLAGRHTGSVGTFGAFSFNGNKIITSGGGGMLVSPDAALAQHARHLTTQAKADTVRYIHDEVGYNYRLTNVQAAIGLAQLELLDRYIKVKRENHAAYVDALQSVPGVSVLGVPEGTSSNHWFYSVLIEPDEAGADREKVMAALHEEGIQSRPVWELNHRQAPYRAARAWGIERAQWFWERVLNVPCSTNLTRTDVERVARVVRDVCRG